MIDKIPIFSESAHLFERDVVSTRLIPSSASIPSAKPPPGVSTASSKPSYVLIALLNLRHAVSDV